MTSRVATKTCISPVDFEINFVKLWNEQKMSAVSGNPPTMKHEELLDEGEKFFRNGRRLRAPDSRRRCAEGVGARRYPGGPPRALDSYVVPRR